MYFLLLFSQVLSQTPTPPQWNNVWAQNFDLYNYGYPFGTRFTTGVFYYNATLNLTRIDRANGRYDPFCGQNEWFTFFDTPCTHLITGDIRYLYYPNLGICCNCCSASDGCGILKPNYMSDSQYLGSYAFNSSTSGYLWNKMDNFLWETEDTNPLNRVTLEFDDGGASKWVFTGSQFDYSVSVFNVPTYCQSNFMCDPNSLCAAVRGSGGKSEHLKHLVF